MQSPQFGECANRLSGSELELLDLCSCGWTNSAAGTHSFGPMAFYKNTLAET